MKRKDILLDFTSLVDIVLIILFFFILFSHLDVESSKAALEEQLAAAQYAELAANEVRENYEADREALRAADSHSAALSDALVAFLRGTNVRLILRSDGPSWTIEALAGEESLVIVRPEDNASLALIEAFESAGFTEENVLLCVFVYEGDRPGTHAAYRVARTALAALHAAFPYLYVSETDISITGGP